MIRVCTNNIKRILGLLPLAVVSALLIPLPVMAELETLPCRKAHLQIEQTHIILRPLEQRQKQLQQDVRKIYQALFACQTGTALSLAEQQQCLQLQKEGPKQFQAMLEIATLSHQTTQLLTRQTRHVQLTCSTRSEDKFPAMTSPTPLRTMAMNK